MKRATGLWLAVAASLPVAALAAQRVAPADARAHLSAILQRREFRAALRESGLAPASGSSRPAFADWLRGLLEEWGRFVRRVLEWLFDRDATSSSRDGAMLPGLSEPMAWMLTSAALVLLGLVGYRILRGHVRTTRADGVEVLAGGGDAHDALAKPAEGWARLSERFAREGRWRLALHALYLELLNRLHQRGAIDCRPQATNGEYVRALGHGPGSAAFARLTRTFDLAWYGNKPFAGADYQAAREHARQVEGAFPEAPP